LVGVMVVYTVKRKTTTVANVNNNNQPGRIVGSSNLWSFDLASLLASLLADSGRPMDSRDWLGPRFDNCLRGSIKYPDTLWRPCRRSSIEKKEPRSLHSLQFSIIPPSIHIHSGDGIEGFQSKKKNLKVSILSNSSSYPALYPYTLWRRRRTLIEKKNLKVSILSNSASYPPCIHIHSGDGVEGL
jgi:hypothetical protein